MRRLLEAMTAAVRRPRATLTGLLVVTLLMGGLATGLEVEVDLTEFGRDDAPEVQAMERVRTEFGDPSAAVQVILDAGPGRNLLDARGLELIATAGDVLVDALGDDVRTDARGRPQVLSLAMAAAGPGGARPEGELGTMLARAVGEDPRLAALVSDDLDVAAGTARASVVVGLLDTGLSEAERTDVAERVQRAFEPAPAALDEVAVTVFSEGLFVTGLVEAIRAELPLLFGLALLVVLAILALTFRSVFDVVVGLAGLLMTVVWTFGSAALLGPAHLGLTGPLSQLAVIVPVLLVGLGIDYSVHLTARYREQRAEGGSPDEAAGGALRTVGAALVLATVATAVGFGSMAAAPLAILADFGVFVAVGVVWAFVIMGLLVPSARIWRDRTRRGGPPMVRELGLGRLTAPLVRLARARPKAGLVGAGLLVAASAVAGSQLAVEFDRDDFVPEGSEVARILALQDGLFGGGVTESTFVVVDGDTDDPALAGALDRAQRALGDVEGVRSVGDTPQARRLEGTADAVAVQVRTTGGDAQAERIRGEVRRTFASVEDAGGRVTVTSEPIIMAQMSDELASYQAQAILLTLGLVAALLALHYGFALRRPALGAVAMLPAAVSAAIVVGVMWLAGFSFNVLTASLTAIAVGIGVPYGVHVVNRFVEDRGPLPEEQAVASTLQRTGGALAGSALTTLGAFVVLGFSGLPPIRSLGLLGGAGIAVALLAALLVEPGALLLWSRRTARRDGRGQDATPSPPVTASPRA